MNEQWMVISTEKQAENEILRTKIEAYENVLRSIAHDGHELGLDKIVQMTHEALYGVE